MLKEQGLQILRFSYYFTYMFMILGTLVDDFGYPEGSFWRSGGSLGIVWVQRVILEAKNVTTK